MSRLSGDFFLKVIFLVVAILKFVPRKLDISKPFTARSFKLGKLIEDQVDYLVKITKTVFASCCFFAALCMFGQKML